MGLPDIQRAIEMLSSDQQAALLDWLAERDRRQWDAQLERDFSPGGARIELLDRVKAQPPGRILANGQGLVVNLGELPVFRPAGVLEVLRGATARRPSVG